MDKLEYPLNLVCAINGISYEELENLPAYSVAEEDVDEVLLELLDRERKVLTQRYKENLTAYEVGRLYGVSRERIKQIEDRALRKLRHPSRTKRINFKTIAILDEKIAKLEQNVLELNTSLFLSSKSDDEVLSCDNLPVSDAELRLLNSNNVITYGDLKKRVRPLLSVQQIRDKKIRLFINMLFANGLFEVNSFTEDKYWIEIKDLNLSMRANNCLRRAGINTIRDFMIRINSYEDLLNIRNLGRKAIYEIIRVLNARGYDVAHLVPKNQFGELVVPAISNEEKLSVEDKLKALQTENDMLRAKLARCKDMLRSEIEELSI